jgi:hypothetical protein
MENATDQPSDGRQFDEGKVSAGVAKGDLEACDIDWGCKGDGRAYRSPPKKESKPLIAAAVKSSRSGA